MPWGRHAWSAPEHVIPRWHSTSCWLPMSPPCGPLTSTESARRWERWGFIFFLIIYLFYFTTLHWLCHTLTSICHGCTCVPHPEPSLLPPSPSHPSGSSQCTSPKDPVSCIEPGLVIHFTYDNLHVSMPFSHIIPLSPSPTESKRLFNPSVSLLLSRIQGYCYHLSKFRIYTLVYCIGRQGFFRILSTHHCCRQSDFDFDLFGEISLFIWFFRIEG